MTRIGVHEVWWGDIVDRPTLFQPLRFFAWGLAMWASAAQATENLPRRKAGHRRPVPGGARAARGPRLADPVPGQGAPYSSPATSWSPIGVALSLILALLRFLTRQNIPDPVMTAVSYMSDIKLYTQPTSPETVPLDHLGQHARFAIRARVLRTVTDAALASYERWWVVAHSLGSVIAFSGLMTPDGLIARYLDEPRWRRLRREYEQAGAVRRDGSKVPVDTNVPCPAWMEPDWCVSRATLLERFAGPGHLRLPARQVRDAVAGRDPGQPGPVGPRRPTLAQRLRRDRSGRGQPRQLRRCGWQEGRLQLSSP